jgi:hypothetical protein
VILLNYIVGGVTMNHHLNWYHNQQEKKKNSMKMNEISLINQELKILMQRIQSSINREDYQVEAREANRCVVQSSIWNVGYRNNMESDKVAVAQSILIQKILKMDNTILHGRAIENEVERLMKRLGHVEWSYYTDYRRELNRFNRKTNRKRDK